eukprot:2843856-Prymnesium_polylepis.1
MDSNEPPSCMSIYEEEALTPILSAPIVDDAGDTLTSGAPALLYSTGGARPRVRGAVHPIGPVGTLR